MAQYSPQKLKLFLLNSGGFYTSKGDIDIDVDMDYLYYIDMDVEIDLDMAVSISFRML